MNWTNGCGRIIVGTGQEESDENLTFMALVELEAFPGEE